MVKKKASDECKCSEKDWEEWGEKVGEKWAEKFADPEKWERCAHKGRIGFGLMVLVIGMLWLLKDLGYIQTLPLIPIALILFALFILLLRL